MMMLNAKFEIVTIYESKIGNCMIYKLDQIFEQEYFQKFEVVFRIIVHWKRGELTNEIYVPRF